MDKFTIVQRYGKLPIPGYEIVEHNEFPGCLIAVIDLHLQDYWETYNDSLTKKVHFRTSGGQAHSYQFNLYRMTDEGDYEKVLYDCWSWWMERIINKSNVHETA